MLEGVLAQNCAAGVIDTSFPNVADFYCDPPLAFSKLSARIYSQKPYTKAYYQDIFSTFVAGKLYSRNGAVVIRTN